MTKIGADPLGLYDILSGLRFSTRFQRHQKLWPQSVAEHSALTAMLADCLVSDAVEWLQWKGYIETAEQLLMQQAEIVRAALWHDALEAYTSDIPRDVKKHFTQTDMGKAAITAMEVDAERTMRADVGGTVPLLSDGIPRIFVKMADFVELVLYVLHEARAGNRGIMLPAYWTWHRSLPNLLKDLEKLQTPPLVLWYTERMSAWGDGAFAVFQTKPAPDHLEAWRT